MAPYEIKNLQELAQNVLDGSEYVSASVTNLTTAGENYCSAIFSVIITAKDGERDRQIHAVAKMIPQNEFIARLFNSEKTFRNEVGYYETIFPSLRQFQKEQRFADLLNSCPDFYGARFSLQPSIKVDDDAVLLVKNIKSDGFAIVDRKVGFDLDQSRLILEKMSELHATVIALKNLKPEAFKNDLERFFQEFNMYETSDDSANKMTESLVDLVRHDDFCVQNLSKIRETLQNAVRFGVTKNSRLLQKGVFTSIVHCDMWTNNIMVKIVDRKTVDVKFVDYQLYEYSSLTRDVVFFLFTSIRLDVVQKHFDDLLTFYFDSFVRWLTRFGCDVSPFKFQDFLDEMASVVKKCEFFHIMLMLRPIFMLDKDAKEVDDLEREDFVNKTPELADGCKPKASFIVRELIRRGWI